MVFSSLTFLVVFLPIVFLLYYILPSIRWKNILLLIASLVFYAMGEPYYIFLLLISCIVNYFLAIGIAKYSNKKLFLVLDIVFNLGLLFFFKYSSFTLSFISNFGISTPEISIVLPIGISFYTFQIISYIVDVYRNTDEVQTNFLHLVLYISFFPQLIAGPIVKYHDISEQLINRKFDIEKVSAGACRFIFGLSKKVIISNNMAIIVDQVYAMPFHSYNILVTWIAAICYCLQIYYDFSGYSDMAIGLGKMFGFDFLENFNYPYSSTTIKEFWRRWHISLSSWFREYLYIPLGGNRKGKKRTIINKFIVFFCTGLWHGANYTFILWGLINGLFSSLEEKGTWAKRISGTFLGWIYTSVVVTLCFVIFRSDSLLQALYFYKNMFFGFHIQLDSLYQVLIHINYYRLFIFILAVLFMFDWKTKYAKYIGVYPKYLVSILMLLLCIMSLASSQYNPFIYFRF